MFFWSCLAFSMIQSMLAIWSLVPLSFLKQAWTSGNSQFTYGLKPGLENFEHSFTSMWDECNCAVVWAFYGMPFFGIGMKTDLFQSCGHCWVFQICWHIECDVLTYSPHSLISCSSQALEHRLSSCGPWSLLLQGMWDLAKPEIEPILPALASGIFTTEPPGKGFLKINSHYHLYWLQQGLS